MDTQPTKLNVILHGLSFVVIDNQFIEIVVPRIEGHLYLAGTFLKENELEDGVGYHLEGVIMQDQRPRIDHDSNLVFKEIPRVNRAPGFVRNVICLPYSADPKPAFQANGPEYGGSPTKLVNAKPDKVTLTTVFSYEIDSLSKLRLVPFNWEPEPDPQNPDFVNLHIYTDGLVEPPEQMMSNFEQAMRLFPGIDCHIKKPSSDGFLFPPVDGITSPDQVVPLDARTTVHTLKARSNCLLDWLKDVDPGITAFLTDLREKVSWDALTEHLTSCGSIPTCHNGFVEN